MNEFGTDVKKNFDTLSKSIDELIKSRATRITAICDTIDKAYKELAFERDDLTALASCIDDGLEKLEKISAAADDELNRVDGVCEDMLELAKSGIITDYDYEAYGDDDERRETN